MGTIIDVSEALLILGLSASVTDEERGITNQAIRSAEGAVKRYLLYNPKQARYTEYYPRQDFNPQASESTWEVTATLAYQRRISDMVANELQVLRVPVRANPTMDLRIDYDGRSGTPATSFAASTQQVEGVDFWPNYDTEDSDGHGVCRDGILRALGTWPSSPGTVRIEYTAGYTAEELHGQDSVIDASPIVDAVLDETVRRVKKAYANMKQRRGWLAGKIKSESLGDYAYTLDGGGASAMLFGSMMDLMPETQDKLWEFRHMGFAL